MKAMGKKRFTDEQVRDIVAEYRAGNEPVEAVCRKYGISGATLYRWQAAGGRSAGVDRRQLKALERENQELKRLLAKALLTSATLCAMLDRPDGHETDGNG